MDTSNHAGGEGYDVDDIVDNEVEAEVTEGEKLTYYIDENPPLPVMMSSALQHILMNLAFGLMTAFVIADVICAPYDSPVRTRLFSSTLFMSGVCTLLQTGLGVRLPIYQGPSLSFLPALLALRSSDEWKCATVNSTSLEKGMTYSTGANMTGEFLTLSQTQRLQQLSGSLMVSSLFEIIIGSTGLVGYLLRYIGPVTVGPTIVLIGISMYKVPIEQAQSSWEVAIGGLFLTLVFALYLSHLRIPLPKFGKNNERSYFPIFQLLPVFLSIVVMWGFSGLLTITGVFPDDPSSVRYKARTDAKISLIDTTPWFLVPYPGQFGFPSFSLAAFVGFMTGFCASMIESVGDYFAAARACQVNPPPDHAVSRGILMEGLGGLLGGAVGTAHATTSYSGSIAALKMTKTASRSVLICCGVQLVVLSMLGKLGAVIAIIPDPALTGVVIVLSGMLISLGIASLRHVNMDSSRNVAIVGVALFIGTFLPEWVDRYPDFIQTGIDKLDGVLKVALGTPMFVGGVFGLVLDNTVRGTKKERGLLSWREKTQTPPTSGKGNNSGKPSYSQGQSVYEWSCVQRLYELCPFLSYLPFMPRRKVNSFGKEESVVLATQADDPNSLAL